MKTIRVPWICCRADEAGAITTDMEWRGVVFSILAYSEKEALDWWRNLADGERQNLLGMSLSTEDEAPSLF